MKEPRRPARELSKGTRERYAIAWAHNRGYPIPKKPGCLLTVCGCIGLLAAVVPGLLCFYFAWKQQQAYERDMKELLMRWADAWENSRADEIDEYRLFMREQEQRRLEARYEDEETAWD